MNIKQLIKYGYKHSMADIKRELKLLEIKIEEIRKLEIQQESGKLSIAENQGGELSLVETGGLSIIGE